MKGPEGMSKPMDTSRQPADRQKVLLQSAYWWMCPDCGQENFTRAVSLDLTDEEKREMIAQAEGVDVDEVEIEEEMLRNLQVMASPEEVQCFNCSEVFESEDVKAVDLVDG